MKIKEDVLSVLVKSTVVDNVLYLPQTQLERDLYVAVNKCLESIGGKWNRKIKGHMFDHDPEEDLEEMINIGEWTDVKKELQYFPTPEDIVEKMLTLVSIEKSDILLEPSAGTGNILKFFPKENKYFGYEINPSFCKQLSSEGYDKIECKDFLQSNNTADVIVMNPPFTKQQDVDHILHAWNCLNTGGRLVAIVSESPFFRENKKSQLFRKWMKDNDICDIELESGDFKSSGTMVKTRIIYGTK